MQEGESERCDTLTYHPVPPSQPPVSLNLRSCSRIPSQPPAFLNTLMSYSRFQFHLLPTLTCFDNMLGLTLTLVRDHLVQSRNEKSADRFNDGEYQSEQGYWIATSWHVGACLLVDFGSQLDSSSPETTSDTGSKL